MDNKCTNCGADYYGHEVYQNGTVTRLCCECNIELGGIAADWHTRCMRAKKAKAERERRSKV